MSTYSCNGEGEYLITNKRNPDWRIIIKEPETERWNNLILKMGSNDSIRHRRLPNTISLNELEKIIDYENMKFEIKLEVLKEIEK